MSSNANQPRFGLSLTKKETQWGQIYRNGFLGKWSFKLIPTKGSLDNIDQLTKAKVSCKIHFGLSEDGLDWGDLDTLKLVARLPTSEAVLFLGKSANTITLFSDLQNKRIGIGPKGSGTA